jgi:hypothetical protein
VGLISQAFFLPRINGQPDASLSSATTKPRGNGNPLQTTSFRCGKRTSHAFAVIAALLLDEHAVDFTSPVTT